MNERGKVIVVVEEEEVKNGQDREVVEEVSTSEQRRG